MDLQAFLITFRESLEAILIVGLILSYLHRLNSTKYNKWVYAGVGLALISSFIVALIFQIVFTGFSTFGAEIYLKVSIMFASVVLLTHMVLWMTKQSKDIHSKMQKKIELVVTAGSASAMILHSYLIVLREGVETVFFFAAISGGEVEKVLTSYGALSGLLMALIVGYLFFSGTMRISLKAFFSVTGVLIMFIAAGLLVQGIGILQDLGKMGSLYEGANGKPAPVYNIVSFMPEHPNDEMHYVRDTGKEPLISGQVGLFMAAMFGYSHNPSIEEVLAYWLCFAAGFAYIRIVGQGQISFRFWKTKKEKYQNNDIKSQQKQTVNA